MHLLNLQPLTIQCSGDFQYNFKGITKRNVSKLLLSISIFMESNDKPFHYQLELVKQ